MISQTLFVISLLLQPADEAAAREEFYRALRQAQTGQAAEAVEALVRLAEENPGAVWSAEALAEAARLCEEEIYRPQRALELYRRLLEKYPSSRPASRAKGRADFISTHLDKGPEVLAAYLKIQRQAGQLGPKESAEKMMALLESQPGFSLEAAGKIWAASLFGQAGERERARKLLRHIAENHSSEREAAQALIELANQALAEGEVGEAEEAYRKLAGLGEQWRLASQGGLEQVRRLKWRIYLPPAAALIWCGGVAWLWASFFYRLRRTPRSSERWRLPLEAWIYSGVMLPIMVLAAMGSRHTTRAVFLTVPVTLLLLIPNGWWWKLRERAAAIPLLGRLLGLALSCLAGMVVAIVLSGYYDELWHTIEFGPGE